MTPEAFAQFLQRGPGRKCTAADGMQLAELVAAWSEGERKKLAKTAVDLFRGAGIAAMMNDYRGYLELAVLAVGPWSEVRRPTYGYFHVFEEAATKILCDRRPEWLPRWVESRLDGDFPLITWWMLNEFVTSGACPKPTSDGYLRVLASITGPWSQREQYVPRSELIVANPHVIDDLWRLFEVETWALSTGVTQPGSHLRSEFEDWHGTLLLLSERGHLDRTRLIDTGLRAIGSDFSAAGLTGYMRFHARLSLTIDELAQREAVYLDLLSNRRAVIVTFALEQLTSLHKAEQLDGAAFLAAAGSVFALKPKGQSQQVLSLARQIAKTTPALVLEAANLAIAALAHESSDVQAAATKLLEGWSSRLHRDHASELRDKLAGLAATIRPRVEAIIQQLSPTSANGNEAPSTETHDWSEWKARVAALDPQWRSLSGASDALECAESDCLYPGCWWNINYIPVLTSCVPIQPIATVDELLDVVAHALEELESADDLERILDGISRLCDQQPDDFELRAAPLLKRLTEEYRGSPGAGILSMHGMSPGLRQLLLRWLRGQALVRAGHFGDPRSLAKFIDRRLYEIEQRVVARRALPLLAAPTHEHGWLDPRVLVQRLKLYVAQDRDPPLADLIQALLRIAPDHCPEALAEATYLSDEWGAAVRFALRGNERPSIHDDHSCSLWLAAARARQAEGPLDELAKVADAARAPLFAGTSYVWDTKPGATAPGHFEWDYAVSLHVHARPELPRHPGTDLRPTLCVREESPGNWEMFGQHWSRVWQEQVWPANLDAMLVAGVRALRMRVNMPASALAPNYVYLRPLLQADRSWNDLAYLAVWVGLLSKDPGSRGMAIDVLIVAIEDGRAIHKFDVLLKLAQASWVKLNRLADATREIARVSPRHAWWIAELLEDFVANLKPWSSDVHHLLALLLELFTEFGLSLDAGARERLQTIKATGKGEKLLKALLACECSPSRAQRSIAHGQLLKSCCERAERWAQASPLPANSM